MTAPRPRSRPLLAAGAAVAAIATLGACGQAAQDQGARDGATGGKARAAPSTAGLPRALAANVKDADKLIGDGESPRSRSAA